MTDEKPYLTDAEIKEIAERRAASLKRVQEMHQKANHEGAGGKGSGKSPKAAPPRGRSFRHQGR